MIQRLCFLTLAILQLQCATAQPTTMVEPTKIILDETDLDYGYYYAVLPKKKKKIKGVMVLLPGFGQKSEDIFLDTKLPQVAYENQLLTIAFSGRMRMTADELVQEKLNAVLTNVLNSYKISTDTPFFLGGFSAGGIIVLRYAELCKEFPEKFPINPRAVFMADSPVDMFKSWDSMQQLAENNKSEMAVNEAKWVEKFYRDYYETTPSENPDFFKTLTPFSMDESLGTNERFLKEVAVRAYHDVDIAWRLVNRNQTAQYSNYIVTSELINRLMLLGNTEAEFVQTFQTGYRRNGNRHPHSWSIIDAEKCVQWLLGLIE